SLVDKIFGSRAISVTNYSHSSLLFRLLRHLAFELQFILYVEKPRHTARSQIGQLGVTLVGDNAFQRSVSISYNYVNGWDCLDCVTEKWRIITVESSVERSA